MTAIAGVVQDGTVYMGGDSASSDGGEIKTSTIEKVFVSGPFLIGYTFSWRMGQLLRFALKAPVRKTQDVEEYMATHFIDAVRKSLKDGGFAHTEKGEVGGTFLVGYEGRLFTVGSDYQVNEHALGFDACGSGDTYALGALYALRDTLPEKRIVAALEAAAEFSTTVRGPFCVKSLGRLQ